jgi:hypoxanthine phosphoribosyltransferase
LKATPEEAWRILESADEVCSAECVATEVTRLAGEITARLQKSEPLVLGVMRGSVIFAGQLLPQLRFPLHFDYLDVTRYGNRTTGGEITWKVSPGPRSKAASCSSSTTSSTKGTRSRRYARTCSKRVPKEFYSAVFAQKDLGTRQADRGGLRRPHRAEPLRLRLRHGRLRRVAQPSGDLRDARAMLAIIGGSGLTQLANLEVVRRRGSSARRTAIPRARSPTARSARRKVAFLARHGYGHTIPPHKVNYRANMWALAQAKRESTSSPSLRWRHTP